MLPPREDLKWLAVDLDKTLADTLPLEDILAGGIGKPILSNVEKLKQAHNKGMKIVIHTARGWAEFERIESWLNEHEIPFKTIVCGKLLAYSYVDDRAVPEWFKDWTWTHDEAKKYYTDLETKASYVDLYFEDESWCVCE